MLALRPEVVELCRHLRALRVFKTDGEVSSTVPSALGIRDDAANRVGVAFGVKNAGMRGLVALYVAACLFQGDVR